MNIEQIIHFLEVLKERHGNITISCDFSAFDTEGLYYNSDLNCVFGE